MSNGSGINRRLMLKGAVAGAAGLAMGHSVLDTAAWAADNTAGGKAVKTYKNEDFYKDGVFQQDKAKQAYWDMMKRFNYPIPPALEKGMWAIEFGLGDFVNVGMAGIFWCNNEKYSYFGHEIYLLPGQMIAEHGHKKTAKGPAKMEAWHVRHGLIYTFGEGEATEPAPIKLPESQKDAITCKKWKKVMPGELDELTRPEAMHFMIAGPEGAIVTEYASFHDGDGLMFTNKKAKL
jgi:hypothetical protein